MSFAYRLLSSALLTGAVFSAAVLPIATLGSKPVTIQLEENPVFVGQLRELAGPYLGLATAISLGAGAVSLSFTGWRAAKRQMSLAEAEVAKLQQQLQEKELVVERLSFSESRLRASGLAEFLAGQSGALVQPDQLIADADSTRHSTAHSTARSTGRFHRTGSDSPAMAEAQKPSPLTPPPLAPVAAINYQTKARSVAALPSAQVFQGYVRPAVQHGSTGVAKWQRSNASPEPPADLDGLLIHLKQVMSEIERLQIGQSSIRPGESNS